MIKLSAMVQDALSEAFEWYAKLSSKPQAIASLNAPRENCLYFVSHIGEAGLSLPPSSVALVPNGSGYQANIKTVEVESPRVEIARILQVVRRAKSVGNVSLTTDGYFIRGNPAIGSGTRISPGAVIENEVFIGKNCDIGPNSVIRNGVRIGSSSIIQAGSVIGEDGYGQGFPTEGWPEPIAHLGGVLIGDSVSIGPNSVVCAGTIDSTIIGSGCKIDGLVYIGHNSIIGEATMITTQSVIGGSAKIGKDVWVNPGGLIKTKLKVSDTATVGMGAVVMKSVDFGETVIGNPAEVASKRLRRDARIDRFLKREDAAHKEES